MKLWSNIWPCILGVLIGAALGLLLLFIAVKFWAVEIIQFISWVMS